MPMKARAHCYKLLLLATGRGEELSFFKILKQAERKPAYEIEQLQASLLRKLLEHAYARVPYYRWIINELGGLEFLAKTEPTTALSKLPLLTKDLIRKHWEELKSQDLEYRKWYLNASGGSTGEPVRLIQDWEYHQRAQAVKRLFDSWTGYALGMPKVILWGSMRDLLIGKETLKTRLGRWIRNEYWFNTLRMDESDMRNCVRVINKLKPVQILAYVGSIYELSRFIEREGLTVHAPQAIMTSAGTLYPHMRELIERVFQAPVFNRYGSREVGDIACECEAHQGLHVSPLTHYVEIIRDDGSPAAPGEVGEVVLTCLTNYAMPLIRYRIGDMAVWAETGCSCGRNWPLLKAVTGRVTDTIVSASGTKVLAGYFAQLLYFKDWVKKFQFIQESYTCIRLLVVPTISFDQAKQIAEREKADLEAKIRLVMGPECNLEIELVNDIPPTPSGKYRHTISKVHDAKVQQS